MPPENAVEEELFTHFPTYLMRRRHRDRERMNESLAAYILGLEAAERNKVAGTSNIGGFHSNTRLLAANEPAIAEVRQLITDGVIAFLKPYLEGECARPPQNINISLWGWCVVMREGDANQQHMHPDANVSGVYYVAVPETVRAAQAAQPFGGISFADPRPRANTLRLPNQISAHPFQPEPGDLLLFPSYYEHSVMPFRGPGERICIAFNAKAG